MTCNEFQEVLPEVVEGVRSIDQEAHLKSCSSCLDLVADLEVIFREARQLEGLYEPSPRVWNSIEATLRQEGLIREPHRIPELVRSSRRPWVSAWFLAPVAALALIAFSFFQQGRSHEQEAARETPVVVARVQKVAVRPPSADDRRVLEVASFPSPAVRETYEANLRDVNAYIQDAEASAKQDPNDEEAQRSLMNAYEQRAMVYEMAMDRSLP
jgi:hypothetical protein